VVFGMMDRKNKRGRPSREWIDDIKERCQTDIHSHAFLVAAAKLWNELPGDVTASQSLVALRRQLKTLFFCLSYPVI